MTVRVKIEKDGSLVYKDFPLENIRFKNRKDEKEEKEDKADEELKNLVD